MVSLKWMKWKPSFYTVYYLTIYRGIIFLYQKVSFNPDKLGFPLIIPYTQNDFCDTQLQAPRLPVSP